MISKVFYAHMKGWKGIWFKTINNTSYIHILYTLMKMLSQNQFICNWKKGNLVSCVSVICTNTKSSCSFFIEFNSISYKLAGGNNSIASFNYILDFHKITRILSYYY